MLCDRYIYLCRWNRVVYILTPRRCIHHGIHLKFSFCLAQFILSFIVCRTEKTVYTHTAHTHMVCWYSAWFAKFVANGRKER